MSLRKTPNQPRSTANAAGRFEIKFKNDGKPVRVERLAISVLGGIQPEKFAGTLAANEQAVISARVPGPVARIDVDLGSVVKQGQVVAEIDSLSLLMNCVYNGMAATMRLRDAGYETIMLLRQGNLLYAAINVVGQMIVCLVAVWMGAALMRGLL